MFGRRSPAPPRISDRHSLCRDLTAAGLAGVLRRLRRRAEARVLLEAALHILLYPPTGGQSPNRVAHRVRKRWRSEISMRTARRIWSWGYAEISEFLGHGIWN